MFSVSMGSERSPHKMVFAWRSSLAAMGTAIFTMMVPAAADACLTFEETLRVAANNDPGVRIARADLDDAEADLQEARSLRRPQVSAFGRTGVGDNGLVDSQIENQIGLRASQRIYDFGDSRLARETARENVRAQENLILDARVQSGLEAGLEFIAWVEATEQLEATKERLDYFDQQLEAIESLLDEGGVTTLERAEIAAEKATAQAEQFEFRFRRDRAKAQVAIATGIDLDLCHASAMLLEVPVNDAPSARALDDLVGSALQANPRLEALRRTAAGLDASARRAARERLPVIDVVGIASYASEDYSGQFDFQNRVGVNVSVPLLSGSALNARSRQARARAARSDGELAAARRTLREDVEVTYRRTLLLEDLRLRREDILELKTGQFDGAHTEYDAGLRTLPDLIDVRLELEAAALQEIRARFDLERERLRLAALTGNFPGLGEPAH